MTNTITTQYGIEIPVNVAVELMDPDLREELHLSFSGDTDQEFFDRYCELHAERTGEEFYLNTRNPQI